MSWSKAFRKVAWIPFVLAILYLGGFIFDSINSGLSLNLVRIYLLNYSIQVILFYGSAVLYFRYTLRAAFFLLSLIFGVFGLCSVKNNTMTDTIRSYIENNLNLDFFVAALTVAALLITLAQIQESQQEKYKTSLYYPPDKKMPTVILKKPIQTENKKQKKK
jgi:hypothetical protein